MRAKFGLALAGSAFALAIAGSASAQESDVGYMRAPVRGPRNALEIGVSAGYTQGFGNLEAGESVRDTANAGAGFGLNIDHRVVPSFSYGLDGTFQQFDVNDRVGGGTDVRGMTVGAHGTFHLAPYQRIDPTITLGTGYRMLWQAPEGDNNNILTHGIQLAKLNLGLDIRVSDSVALGPMGGADLNLFMWRNPEGSAGNARVEDTGVSTFVYAGVQGRFDVGGQRSTKIETIESASRR